jgi:signal transduction histidine kinase/CheY-like chemotaxis protein
MSSEGKATGKFASMRVGRLMAYPLAISSVAIAAIATFVLWHSFFSRNPLVLFYAAVVISAWFGGLGPGLLASALAVILIDYLFLPSFVSGGIDHLMQFLAFAFISAMVSWLDARQRASLIEARTAQAVAEHASSTKDRFLAVLSHELRTPLTPALAASSALEDDRALPEHLREEVQLIRRNIELEARLIDDLLDLTRISRGKLQISVQLVDMHELIRQVIETCRAEVQHKQLELGLELAATASHITGDAARLQQVLWNLVKNAIKFTAPGGHVTIRTSSSKLVEQETETLHVHVSDTGIGISPKLLPRIFDAFEQGDQRINRQFGGLGLGLAIARQLIVMHGGTIVAQSPGQGLGTTFTVTLHDAKAAAAPPPASSPPMTSGMTPLRLLLVEDHVDTANVMIRLLRAAKHEVRAAASMSEALAVARDNKFDLVISDIGLPDGTGVELFAELKRNYGMRGIALSGFGMDEDVQRCLDAGFDAHLTKPVDLRQLHDLIHSVMSASASTDVGVASA